MTRILSAVFSFAAILGIALTAASAGDLKQIRDAQKVAAQKLISQVDAAIEHSRKQDPREAKFALQAMIRRVNDSTDLLEKERQPLVNRLRVRLGVVEDSIRGKSVTQDVTPPRETPRYRPPVNDPGKGVSAGAKGFIQGTKGNAQRYAELDRERTKGIQAINEGIETSAVLTDKEITFAKNWKEISARRVSQNLTPKEAALLKTLNSTLSVDYNNDKFKTVLNHMMERTGLTIIVDPASLQDANVDYEADTVTLKFPKMSVRSALKKILGDRGLTYIIKEGTLQVMTPKRASEYTVIRTYRIDDLVSPDPRVQMWFGPFVAQAQKIQNAQALINTIQSLVEPSYWAPNGPGTIAFEPISGALIIRASAEMHYQLGSPGLFGGR